VAQRQDRERRKATGRSGVYRGIHICSRLWTWKEVEDENDDEDEDDLGKLLRDQLRDALLEWVRHLSNGFYLDQFDERINT
jgi:hypothetical protein